ncbi:PepSY domain-containing protein [Neobacillus drentensis]|uniref:PepSY domain-containing protein n=1 Tax=Neobacillus drentensis TaxID=220684 RepID=UPI003000E2F1
MKKKSWIWIFVLFLLSLTVMITIHQLTSSSGAKHLTTVEAQNLVQNRYQGTVTQIRLTNDQYVIQLKKENRIYKIILDANTAEIVSMEKLADQTPQQILTETEVRALISKKTKGTITSIKKEKQDGKEIYLVSVNEGTNLTTFIVDSVTGTISTSSTVKTEPPKKLTEAEAVKLALQQVDGTVDEISFETKNNQPYYFVKVKAKDKQEAIVQVHAIKGTVVSITWDDDLKQVSDDDNDK